MRRAEGRGNKNAHAQKGENNLLSEVKKKMYLKAIKEKFLKFIVKIILITNIIYIIGNNPLFIKWLKKK